MGSPAAQAACTDEATDLVAGKMAIPVGNVNVCNDDTTLTVTYEATTPWCFLETHLQVASSLDGFPLAKKGNPKTADFEYGDVHPACEGSVSFEIPLDDIGADGAVVVAANATVLNQDSLAEAGAWGEGSSFPGSKSPAMFFTYQACGLVQNLCGFSCPEGEVTSWDPTTGQCGACAAGAPAGIVFPIRYDSGNAARPIKAGLVFESGTPEADALNAAAPNGFRDAIVDVVEDSFGPGAVACSLPADITVTAFASADPFLGATVAVSLKGITIAGTNLKGRIDANDPGGRYGQVIAAAEAQFCGQAIQEGVCGAADVPLAGGSVSFSCEGSVYLIDLLHFEPYDPDVGNCSTPGGCFEHRYWTLDMSACPVNGPVLFRRTAGASGYFS